MKHLKYVFSGFVFVTDAVLTSQIGHVVDSVAVQESDNKQYRYKEK